MLAIVRFLLFSYFIFISFNAAFSFGPWLRLPVVISIISFFTIVLYTISKRRMRLSGIYTEDVFIFIMFIGILISSLVNSSIVSLNYIVAYFYVFVIAFLSFKLAMGNLISYGHLLHANAFGVLFVSLFVLFDFSSYHFLGFDIQKLIPRADSPTPAYLGLRRSFGFSTEPGILAFYFDTLGVVAVWFVFSKTKLKKVYKLFFLSSLFLAWVTTFSAAGLAFVVMSLSTSQFLFILKTMKLKVSKYTLMLVLLPLIAILLSSVLYFKNLTLYLGPIINKLSLSNSTSANTRVERWAWGIARIKEHPLFGSGLGSTSDAGMYSTNNWYMFLTVEGGLISSIPIVIFLMLTGVRILYSNIEGRFWYLSAFIAGVLHLSIISSFFVPFLWAVIILFTLGYRHSKAG